MKKLEKLFFRKYNLSLFRNCVKYAVDIRNIDILKYLHGLRPITKQEYPSLSCDLVRFANISVCKCLDEIGYGLLELPDDLNLQEKHYEVLKIVLCHPELSEKYVVRIYQCVKKLHSAPEQRRAPEDFINLLVKKAKFLLSKRKEG
jgi:hypothetical protein